MILHSISELNITKVISTIRLLKSPVGITTSRKDRESWAVVLKLKGKTIYSAGDQKIISDALHPVILPKGCSYSWLCTEPGECIIIEFQADTTCSKIQSFEIKNNTRIQNAFSKIDTVLNTKNSYAQIECKYHLYDLILFLLRSVKGESPHSNKQNILSPATNYIAEYYFDSTITNQQLSELCGISTVYFRKTFESVYGISPIRYLNNFRINKAKSLLLSDYDTIEQVALSVGYNSIYHFSKMFRQYTGMSPSEYAKVLSQKG